MSLRPFDKADEPHETGDCRYAGYGGCDACLSIEVPAAAKRLAAKAEQHGWKVTTRLRRGEWAGKSVEMVSLLLQRGAGHSYDVIAAQWNNGKFDSALRGPFKRLNSRELAALVTA